MNRRPPLSGKQPTPQSTRKERRATERQTRFDADRDARLKGQSGGSGGAWSLITTRNMTIAAVLAGVLIVVVVGIGQLSGRVTGTLKNPAMSYPANLVEARNLGKADAPVVVQLWEDFQCPVCAKYSLTVEPLVFNKYVLDGTLRIEHHDLGLLGRGTGEANESVLTARGAFCANEQGKYWPYAHWVYTNQDGENVGGFRRERLVKIAVAAGVDEPTFNACLDAPATADAVAATTAEGVALGIDSTPTQFIGGQKHAGLLSAEALGALIDAELAKLNPSPSTTP